MNIFVGNLSYNTTEESLKQAFEPFGQVQSAKVISDRETGRSRGFGFVEMSNEDEARKAIAGLDGKPLDGREVKVNEARPREGGPGAHPGGGGFSRSRE